MTHYPPWFAHFTYDTKAGNLLVIQESLGGSDNDTKRGSHSLDVSWVSAHLSFNLARHGLRDMLWQNCALHVDFALFLFTRCCWTTHCEFMHQSCTVINRHLKQLTRHLSSNHINNKNTDRKSGRSGITLLNVAHNFLPIKILTTEWESSVQFLSIYHTCHHLKQTKYGIS